MYYEHYGLDAAPFKITPDTHLFYQGATRGDILGAIHYAILSGEGIIKVVGEVGSGKTMLCRMLEIKLPKSVEIVYFANPNLSPDDILHAIAFEMQLPVDAHASRLKVMHALQDALVEKHANNIQVVFFIEEAQGMPIETLEEIRLLSNLETSQHKLLQMVLFGQPELDDNLAAGNIRQLKERITQSFYLEPFNIIDIAEYLRFRLFSVGYRGIDIFSPEAVKVFAQASQGLARRINILADKALLAAYSENMHLVTKEHARLAVKDSEFSKVKKSTLGLYWPQTIAAGLLAFVLLLAFQNGAEYLSVPTDTASQQSANKKSTQQAKGPPLSEETAQSPTLTPPKPARKAIIRQEPESPIAISPDNGVMIKMTGTMAVNPVPKVTIEAPKPVSAGKPMIQITASSTNVPLKTARSPKSHIPTTPKPSPAANQPKTPAAKPRQPSGQVATAPNKPAVPRKLSPITSPTPANKLVAKQPVSSTDGNLTTQRTQATFDWLKTASDKGFTVQLMMMTAKQGGRKLETFLRQPDVISHIDKLYIYKTQIKKKSMLGVVYGEYKTTGLALKDINRLPKILKKYSPQIRNIIKLKQDVGS